MDRSKVGCQPCFQETVQCPKSTEGVHSDSGRQGSLPAGNGEAHSRQGTVPPREVRVSEVEVQISVITSI